MKQLKIKDVLLNIYPKNAPVGTNPYIEIGDIDLNKKTYNYKDKKSVSGAKYASKHSIIVSTVRPTRGAIAIIKEDKIAVSNAFAIISVDEKQCNYKYLFYMINNNKFYDYLGSHSKGATYPTCSREDVYNYDIVLPSLEEQNKIVKIFDNIFISIDIKNNQINNFNQLIKSQFVEMFEGKDFEKKTLQEITTKITDGSHNPPSGIAENLGYMMLSSQNIINDKINYEKARYLSKEDFEKENMRTGLKNGDILLTIVGTVGRTAIIKNEKNITLQRSVAVLKPIKEINSYYLVDALKSDDFVKQLNKGAKGVAQKGIYLNDLKKLTILVPPIDLQNKFAMFVEQIDKQKFELEKQLEKLKELQDSLVKEYFG